MTKVISRILAVFLVALTVVCLAPKVETNAAVIGGKFENAQLDIVSDKESTLAPGVTENQYTVYDKNGNQVKMFVATADMSVDSVKVFTSYKDMDAQNYGMSKLTEQVVAFNEKAASGDAYYNGTVVAGINASYYNMVNGKPTGAFVMNGIDVTTESEGNAYGYFAIMKDGSMKIGKPGEYSSDKGNILEALGIYKMLVIDGKIALSTSDMNNTQKYPRQTIGITADNKLIVMSADGNQAPKSVGLTFAEQAQVMLDLGCVWAGHLDGGGSMTYGSKPEGSDNFVITNSPSDGSERSVSNGFIIVSTAVASYEFDHVTYDVEQEYVTPGTPVAIEVTGTSSTGNAADIPSDISYEAVNGTYENGVLTAGSELGIATVTAFYNGKEVGSVSVNVVLPDAIAFSQPNMTVPYGKTVSFGIVATNGIHDVKVKESDFSIVLSNDAMASIEGFSLTACEEALGITGGTMTAVLVADAGVSAVANITFGKGSEVAMDFENGSLGNLTIGTGYMQYGPSGGNGQNECGKLEIVTSETGKVHDGQYALAVEADFTQIYETGYHLLNLSNINLTVPAKAQAIGAWLYIPEIEELTATWIRFCGTDANGTAVNLNFWANAMMFGTEDEGWKYFTMSVANVATDLKITHMQIYCSDRDQTATNYYFKDNASVNSRFTFYLDNITIDYSSAVDDREAPVFESIKYTEVGMAEGAVLNGNTVTSNVIGFFANVKDDTSKNNYTGINAAGAKAYIDGVEVEASYANGVISTADIVLADGVHTVTFEISDNMGNSSRRSRKIIVKANSGMTSVSLVPAAPDADKLLIGSLYWMNLNTTDIEKIENISMALNLNSVSQWELDNIVTVPGFTASYVYDYVTNNAVVTITRTGEVELTGAQTIAQLPIRTWESRLTEYYKYEDQTPAKLWSRKIIWPMDIKLSMDMGTITFADGTTGSFSMADVEVITELYGNYAELNANGDYANKTSWHIHTAEALADKAATCTENGYSGRTFCAVCNSVVDFGTVIPATGHSYAVVDGVLKCECGKLFNGVYTDGKEYVDGVPVADGWSGDSYYLDGVKLTGVQLVEGFYYNFGDNGVCAGKVKYTGVFYDEAIGAYRFVKLGSIDTGWQQIGEDWHYFTTGGVALTGEYTLSNGVTYQFDAMGKTEGAWHTTSAGTRFYYGPSYYVARNPGYLTLTVIDGKTYNFDNNGYYTVGILALRDSTAFKKYVYEFGADGVMIRQITDAGIVNCADGVYVINEEGYIPMDAGIVKLGEDFYYVLPSGKAVLDADRNVLASKTNGLLDAGWYYFGADGKLTTKEEEKPDTFTGIRAVDGVDYYFENGVIAKNAGIVKIGNDFYYVLPSGKIVKDADRCVLADKANGLLDAGWYYFGADGKLTTKEEEKPDTFTGIREVDGVDYYFENGVIAKNAGIVKLGDDFYYVLPSGKIVKNAERCILEEKANGLIDAGWYYFGADGKLVVEEEEEPDTFTGIRAVDGVDYYFENGVIAKNAGIVKIGNDFYYVLPSGKIVKNAERCILEEKANGLIDAGWYFFGADGKLVP